VNLGPFELLVIVAVLLLVFGPAALPRITRNLGKSLGSFQKGLRDIDGRAEVRGTLEREPPSADPERAEEPEPGAPPVLRPPDEPGADGGKGGAAS
jgi:sec-independent protein translocase protein TatA